MEIRRILGKLPKPLIIAGGVGVIALGAWLLGPRLMGGGASEAETLQQEVAVTQGDLTVELSADGAAELATRFLDFEVQGTLAEVLVSEGDRVRAGQVLARLDTTELQEAVRTAEANYGKALASYRSAEESLKLSLSSEKNQLEQASIQLDEAAAAYEPIKGLTEVYSAQEIELSRQAWLKAKASYETQRERYGILKDSTTSLQMEKASLETAAIALEQARRNLDSAVLVAPGDVKILKVSAKVGEILQVTDSSGEATADTTHFMVITESDAVEVVAPVSEVDLATVQQCEAARMQFEAIDGETFTGQATWIDSLPLVDGNNMVTYDVHILLDAPSEALRSGMTCSVSFIVKEVTDVLIIPNQAVTMTDGVQTVRVKNTAGTWDSREIETGFTDGSESEVKAGLKAGEVVAVESDQKKASE